ncbi:MAG: 50S ribosomal protein L33 [Cyanobacteria bacterium HKST-UBA06]|nr:50S ribosomal protein L33 [Cyanobacteria bacterium HKST-UBA05]MCA9797947.1 50S ribosomal protein L33 [Cyanobacteria bacterium HKST-UBA04]MCA9806879.1 50S ribosomal protein L33 [Cyanobacteria bacterium HKST-UBA06]MCA9841379.1 50S ribosomal protein L33 [Cyanobacteria bacterium HKST-UBA03]
MAKKKGQGNQPTILKSTESTSVYHTRKNKTKLKERLELKKFDPKLNRVVLFREEKK